MFGHTHELRADGLTGSLRFERVALPVAGGITEQPAKTMQALAVLESVALAVMSEQAKERRSREGRKR